MLASPQLCLVASSHGQMRRDAKLCFDNRSETISPCFALLILKSSATCHLSTQPWCYFTNRRCWGWCKLADMWWTGTLVKRSLYYHRCTPHHVKTRLNRPKLQQSRRLQGPSACSAGSMRSTGTGDPALYWAVGPWPAIAYRIRTISPNGLRRRVLFLSAIQRVCKIEVRILDAQQSGPGAA